MHRLFASKTSSILAALAAFVYASVMAYDTTPTNPREMELDGWGIKVFEYTPDRMPFSEVIANPSLWKGPIVPTLYSFAYFVYPSPYSVLALNIAVFALAMGLLHRLFATFGHPLAALAAVVVVTVHPHHRILYAYYFSEPLVTGLSAAVLGLLLWKPNRPFFVGALMGILLLARPPFMVLAALVPVVGFAVNAGTRNARLGWSARYSLGLLVTFLPWTIRNLLVLGAFLPFTVEGGQTLFHGSYLTIEEDRWQVLQEYPEVRQIVQAAPKDPVERMHYLSRIAKQQVLADPLGQVVRCTRKGIKFWMYLSPGTWIPEWKTGAFAVVALLLAGRTFLRHRHNPAVFWSAVWIVGLWAMHTLVFGNLRYSFPVQPMLLFLAASAFWPPPYQPNHPIP